MNKNIKELKNPLPKTIKNLSIGFDVSTTMTGYAIIADGQPIIQANGHPSMGSFPMVKQRTNRNGRQVDREYDAYGDRMTHGSEMSFAGIGKMLYGVLRPFTEHYYEMKKQGKEFNIANIYLVFEVSEIPNGGPAFRGQSLTGVRKLGLYTGATLATVWSIIDLVFEPFKDKIQVKLIKPGEWQDRHWSKDEAKKLNVYTGRGYIKQKGSKFMSIKKANEFLKEHGIAELKNYDDNDTADAINIARVAHQVRDNVFASKVATAKKKNVNITYNRDIQKLQGKLNDYYSKGLQLKDSKIRKIGLWQSKDYEKLTADEKRKYTKFAHLDINEEMASSPTTFLTPAEQRNYVRWEKEKAEKEAKLKELRNAKVIK